MKASLHFHHMSNDMDGAGMPGIQSQRAPRRFYDATILPIFFESKGIHRKHAGVARHFGRPLRQHFREPVKHHASTAEVEVERVRNRKRQNVMRPSNKNSVIESGRTSGIAIEPGTRGGSVAARR